MMVLSSILPASLCPSRISLIAVRNNSLSRPVFASSIATLFFVLPPPQPPTRKAIPMAKTKNLTAFIRSPLELILRPVRLGNAVRCRPPGSLHRQRLHRALAQQTRCFLGVVSSEDSGPGNYPLSAATHHRADVMCFYPPIYFDMNI